MRTSTAASAGLLLSVGTLGIGVAVTLLQAGPSSAVLEPPTRTLACIGLSALWALLVTTVLAAGIANRAEPSSLLAAGLLLLGSATGSLFSVSLWVNGESSPWLLALVLAPPPIVGWLAFAVHSPWVRRSAPAMLVNGLWCALIALALLPCPFIARQARIQAKSPLPAVSSERQMSDTLHHEAAS